MDNQPCPPGSIRDSLVKECVRLENPVTDEYFLISIQPSSESLHITVEHEAVTVPPDQCWNFTVWISVCVVFVLSSSVLVLFVWIIYRRYSQGKRNSECPASNHHSVYTNAHGKEDSCAHKNGRKHEVSDCEMGWGRGFCETREESVVPLPATELGDSALVTTKTVQLLDYSHCDAS